MKEKLHRLQQGEKVAVFDKKMVIALGALTEKKVCCRQEDNQFTVWIANEQEQMRAFKKWCKVMNFNYNSVTALQQYLIEGGIIWQV